MTSKALAKKRVFKAAKPIPDMTSDEMDDLAKSIVMKLK